MCAQTHPERKKLPRPSTAPAENTERPFSLSTDKYMLFLSTPLASTLRGKPQRICGPHHRPAGEVKPGRSWSTVKLILGTGATETCCAHGTASRSLKARSTLLWVPERQFTSKINKRHQQRSSSDSPLLGASSSLPREERGFRTDTKDDLHISANCSFFFFFFFHSSWQTDFRQRNIWLKGEEHVWYHNKNTVVS